MIDNATASFMHHIQKSKAKADAILEYLNDFMEVSPDDCEGNYSEVARAMKMERKLSEIMTIFGIQEK